MSTRNLYLIVGPSGSGKTTLVNSLCNMGYTECISYTTRPPRSHNERYHFVTKAEFRNLTSLIESTEYDGNYYGTTEEDLDCSDICIVDIPGVLSIRTLYSKRPIKIIGVTASVEELTTRVQKRNDESLRRIVKDIEAFKQLPRICDLLISSKTPEETLAVAGKFILEQEQL